MKNKKLISNILIWLGIMAIAVHAVFKLQASGWVDWQHWGVLVADVMIIVGMIIRGMR